MTFAVLSNWAFAGSYAASRSSIWTCTTSFTPRRSKTRRYRLHMAPGSVLAAVITARRPPRARAATCCRMTMSPSRSSAPPIRISRPFGTLLAFAGRAASMRGIRRVRFKGWPLPLPFPFPLPFLDAIVCLRVPVRAMERYPPGALLQKSLPAHDRAVTHQHLPPRDDVTQLERMFAEHQDVRVVACDEPPCAPQLQHVRHVRCDERKPSLNRP